MLSWVRRDQKMKKVLFVATVVKTHIMTFHIPYLEWFKKNGFETHVCAKNDYEVKEECNIPFCDKFYDLPFERSPFKYVNINVYKQLNKIISDNKYDIIHCHTPMGGALTRLAAINSLKNGTKVIYTAHGFHFFKGAPTLNWLLYYPAEKLLSKYTNVLITVNKEDYEIAHSFNAGKVEYIPGIGIDIKKFDGVNINIADKRRELGLPYDAFVLLSIGELNKNKNHEIIIRALAQMKDDNIYYIICGQGELKEYLIKLSYELGIENQIKLLGYRSDIDNICKISDLYVFPSYREGLSLSLMESMASGLPVVCSKIRGNIDLIDDKKGGFLVNPDDINGFCEAILKMKNNRTKNEMGQYNASKVKSYDIKNVMKIMEKIYKSEVVI